MLAVNYGRAEADNQPKFKNLKPSNLILKRIRNVPHFRLIRVTNIPETFSLVAQVQLRILNPRSVSVW